MQVRGALGSPAWRMSGLSGNYEEGVVSSLRFITYLLENNYVFQNRVCVTTTNNNILVFLSTWQICECGHLFKTEENIPPGFGARFLLHGTPMFFQPRKPRASGSAPRKHIPVAWDVCFYGTSTYAMSVLRVCVLCLVCPRGATLLLQKSLVWNIRHKNKILRVVWPPACSWSVSCQCRVTPGCSCLTPWQSRHGNFGAGCLKGMSPRRTALQIITDPTNESPKRGLIAQLVRAYC